VGRRFNQMFERMIELSTLIDHSSSQNLTSLRLIHQKNKMVKIWVKCWSRSISAYFVRKSALRTRRRSLSGHRRCAVAFTRQRDAPVLPVS